jgi:hypothetical protein
MIKQLLLLVQFLWIFIYQLFFSLDVTVNQQLPSKIAAGSEAVVEIVINKSDASGFAKVQQDFPEGFNAEPIETKGATFSFKDNKVKFIWMALPSEEQFTISYKLIPNTNTKGNFSLAGKFSYIADSERKNIDINTVSYTVEPASEEEPVVEVPSVEEPVATKEEEPVIEEPIVETPVIEDPVAEETTIEVNCVRTIALVEEGKYKVTTEITKKGIQGFAKLTEIVPDGFIALEDNANGGVFSFKEKEAKILWLVMPKNETFTVSYFIQAKDNTINKTYSVSGSFSYLKGEETEKYTIAKSDFTLDRKAVIVEEQEPIAEKEPIKKEPVVKESVKKEPIVEVPVAEEPIVEETTPKNNTKEITSIPNPETKVTYKVQVGAGHQTVANNYFAVKFNLQDNVSTENHEGWIKYIVGSFNEYKAARDKRNNVRNNVKTAFVTAYNSGKRITVQEALMISNQKWYK